MFRWPIRNATSKPYPDDIALAIDQLRVDVDGRMGTLEVTQQQGQGAYGEAHQRTDPQPPSGVDVQVTEFELHVIGVVEHRRVNHKRVHATQAVIREIRASAESLSDTMR